MALIELPSIVVAGVTLNFRVTTSMYSPPEWILTIGLRGPAAHDLTATADGYGYVIDAASTVTALWPAGEYIWAARFTDTDGLVMDGGSGSLQVVADIMAMTGTSDVTTHAQRVLASIEAVIEKRATKDQQSYKIGNRELQRMSISDLLVLRDRYRAEVARERRMRNGKGSLFGQHVRVRF